MRCPAISFGFVSFLLFERPPISRGPVVSVHPRTGLITRLRNFVGSKLVISPAAPELAVDDELPAISRKSKNGCTCASTWQMNNTGDNIACPGHNTVHHGCDMDPPCDDDSGGGVWSSWCLTAVECAGNGGKQWDYCNPTGALLLYAICSCSILLCMQLKAKSS